MNSELIYILIILILIIILIVIIVLTQEGRKNLINVGECTKIKGEYAVDAGFDSSNILYLCGSNGNSVCTFTVSSLENAFDICNTNADKCSRFTYNTSSQSISFISDIPSFDKNPDSNIYIRQGGTVS